MITSDAKRSRVVAVEATHSAYRQRWRSVHPFQSIRRRALVAAIDYSAALVGNLIEDVRAEETREREAAVRNEAARVKAEIVGSLRRDADRFRVSVLSRKASATARNKMRPQLLEEVALAIEGPPADDVEILET